MHRCLDSVSSAKDQLFGENIAIKRKLESAEADAPALRRRRHPHAAVPPPVAPPSPAAPADGEDEALAVPLTQREPLLPPDRRTGGRRRRPR